MKNIFFAFCVLSIVLFSCEETGPLIILEEEVALLDTTYIESTIPSAQDKGVLMEEFSGVHCSNCPEGNLATHDLVNTYGERLVPITVHSDFLGFPYDGDQDLRTEDANAVADNLGPINGKPATFIDRKIFSGNTTREIIFPNTWEGFVQQQLALTTPVNLDIEVIDVNTNDRKIVIQVKATYTNAANGHNLGLAITESEIIATQLDGSNVLEDYEHEFVLRDFVTPIIGSPLTDELAAGRVFLKQYEVQIPEQWDIDHLDAVAFVRSSNDDIVHAAKAEIIQ